jgi:hypothetical protein
MDLDEEGVLDVASEEVWDLASVVLLLLGHMLELVEAGCRGAVTSWAGPEHIQLGHTRRHLSMKNHPPMNMGPLPVR